ncbi:hypothetical protein [Thermobifida cellulosilytica]|uniref:hypothetical protein n=1 Tax=Thermobifida cellulosilytica TaxID=144786 RepID=UPI0008398D6C|nr:hypothetical protein [Thermobifida cellulosilytica]
MTAPLSASSAEADRSDRPPVSGQRRALGALLFAVCSAVLAAAALAVVSAPISLLLPSEASMLAPGAVATLGLAGLLVLLSLWALLGRVLRGLGVQNPLATASLALIVPVGYAISRVGWYGPVDALWWASGLSALAGLLVCVAATGRRGSYRKPVLAVTAALVVLVGGVLTENEVIRLAPRSEFDRHPAIPVLRHPDWDLEDVEASPERAEVLVEYRNIKREDAEPLYLHVYRREAENWESLSLVEGTQGQEVVKRDGTTVVLDVSNGPSLYLNLDLGTRVRVVWASGTDEELLSLAGYIGAATGVERAELRSKISPFSHG